MKNVRSLFLGLNIILIGLTLNACNTLTEVAKKNIKEPEVNYKNFTVGKVSSEGIELIPVFEVKNNNPFTIPLDKLDYALSFNEKTMLDGAIEDIGSLPANGSTEVPISFMLNKDVLASFKELLINNEKLDFEVTGKAKVLGLSVPFEKKDTFYRPKISFGKLDIGPASFEKLSATVNLTIDNPNSFALPLGAFNYNVSSKNKELISGEIDTKELKQGLNEIQVPIAIKPEELFSNFFSLLRDPDLPLDFSFDSPLNSFQQSQTIDLKKLIQL